MNALGVLPVSILKLTFDELQAQLAVWKEPGFRARQIWEWLYVHWVTGFEEMSNLPKPLRKRLGQFYSIDPLTLVDECVSEDELTRKALFRLSDGETIETVLIEYDLRHTVCVSSQVGCPVGCAFCATGQGGFARDLQVAEIVAQPLYFARWLRACQAKSVTHVVVMGMGEPLLNYDAVWKAVETWNDRRGFALGARKITLSSAGYVPGIERLAGESLQVGLAISLHAADDALRDRLVPLNRKYPLADLLVACREYVARTGRRITVEYALIDGVNDSIDQAHRLADLLGDLLCHVNLIPLNPTAGTAYCTSPREKVQTFRRVLDKRHISVTVRLRRGFDIEAGCGQLRRRGEAGHAASVPIRTYRKTS